MNTHLHSPTGGDAFQQFNHSLYKSPSETKKESLKELDKGEGRPRLEEGQSIGDQKETTDKKATLSQSQAKISDIFLKYFFNKKNIEHDLLEAEKTTREIRREKYLRQAREAKKQAFKEELDKAHQKKEERFPDQSGEASINQTPLQA